MYTGNFVNRAVFCHISHVLMREYIGLLKGVCHAIAIFWMGEWRSWYFKVNDCNLDLVFSSFTISNRNDTWFRMGYIDKEKKIRRNRIIKVPDVHGLYHGGGVWDSDLFFNISSQLIICNCNKHLTSSWTNTWNGSHDVSKLHGIGETNKINMLLCCNLPQDWNTIL